MTRAAQALKRGDGGPGRVASLSRHSGARVSANPESKGAHATLALDSGSPLRGVRNDKES
jgi:hypothetical protein